MDKCDFHVAVGLLKGEMCNEKYIFKGLYLKVPRWCGLMPVNTHKAYVQECNIYLFQHFLVGQKLFKQLVLLETCLRLRLDQLKVINA